MNQKKVGLIFLLFVLAVDAAQAIGPVFLMKKKIPPYQILPNPANLECDDSIELTRAGGRDPYGAISLASGSGSFDATFNIYSAPQCPAVGTASVTSQDNQSPVKATATTPITYFNPYLISPSEDVVIQITSTPTFTTTGGYGASTFSIVSGDGSIGASSGIYTPPAVIGANPFVTIQATDSIGNTATVFDAYLANGVAITKRKPIVPVQQTLTLTAAGGATPYSWQNVGTIGTINATSGLYTAPASALNGSISDPAWTTGTSTIRVTDSSVPAKTNDVTLTVVKPIKMVVGLYHGCVLYTSSAVRCWGDGINGALGNGSTADMGDANSESGGGLPWAKLGVVTNITDIVAGYAHNCVLTATGQVKCWGLNSSGQLGYGNTSTYGASASTVGDQLPFVNFGAGRTAQKIWAGGHRTCALLDNNALKCWGDNTDGALGIGDTINRGTSGPRSVANSPVVDVGTGRIVTDMAMNSNSTCAILDNGTMKCWGSNFYGQLGLGQTMGAASNSIGDAAGEMGDSLSALTFSAAPIKIAGRMYTFCAILTGGAVSCWGRNNNGQIGDNSVDDKNVPTQVQGLTTGYDKVGVGGSGISTNQEFACASKGGTVNCWGANPQGQLLQGNTTRSLVPVELLFGIGVTGNGQARYPLPSGTTVTSLGVGGYFGCILFSPAIMKCWGSFTNGVLLQGGGKRNGQNWGDAASENALYLPYAYP